jgi:metallo-beta-lactamase family protein
VQLSFLGAAGEVTGSCYLVDTGAVKFLIECGMRQGGAHADAANRRFAFDPREIAFVLLSHAHIDHSGLLPRLMARGFGGPVYATRATCELLGVMLPDSGYLQEKDAEREGGEPLYTLEEAKRCLERLQAVEYGEEVEVHPDVRCRWLDAGHILGSAILDIRLGKTKLVFTGDLGQPGRPVVEDPTPVAEADVLLVESTYGNRNHKTMAQTLDEFAFALNDTLASKRGNVVIPAFAVGRTQDILEIMGELQRAGRLPKLDAYVDSPMATEATRSRCATRRCRRWTACASPRASRTR